MKMIENNGIKTAFVCFGDLYSGGADKLRGFKDAARAQAALNNFQCGYGRLYVNFKKSKLELQQELINNS